MTTVADRRYRAKVFGGFFWRSGTAARRPSHDNFEGIFRRSARQLDGGGGLFQWKAVSDEQAHIELARENQPGDFVLQREIG
jgi:hypothetical protein